MYFARSVQPALVSSGVEQFRSIFSIDHRDNEIADVNEGLMNTSKRVHRELEIILG